MEPSIAYLKKAIAESKISHSNLNLIGPWWRPSNSIGHMYATWSSLYKLKR